MRFNSEIYLPRVIMDSYNFSNENVTAVDVTPNGTKICVQNNSLFTIAFIPFKVIVMFLNLILLSVAARDREKLQRQNYTYFCVMSTLLSNTVYLLMSIWLTVDNYPQVARDPQEGIMSVEKVVWIFSEAVTLSMVLGICANVTSLIYVTIDSVFYVGRKGTGWANVTRNQQNSMSLKIRVAQMLVVASWALPVIITGLTFIWNCAAHCRCPSNNFEGEHCPREESCSSMWAPMKMEFLYTVIALWTLEIVGLIIFLINGIRRHYMSTELPDQGFKSNVNKVEEGECEVVSDVRTMTSQNNIESAPMKNTSRRKSTMKRRFNSRLKFATALTCVLVVCTAPAAISTIVDIAMDDPPYSVLILISGVFMFLYCAVCPVLMWKFLPSLRSSTLKFLMGIKNCALSRDVKKAEETPPVFPNSNT